MDNELMIEVSTAAGIVRTRCAAMLEGLEFRGGVLAAHELKALTEVLVEAFHAAAE